MEMIKQDRKNGILPQWYGGDALYGRAVKMTSFIEDECGANFVMDTTKNQLINLKDPSDKRRKSITVEKYLRQIDISKEKIVRYEGAKKARVHIAAVIIKDKNQKENSPHRQLIISKGLSKNDKIKISLTNFTLQEKTAAQLVYMQRARFNVEQYFREASQVAGMADYQVRGQMGWQHVQILSMLIMQLLNIVRLKLATKNIGLSLIANRQMYSADYQPGKKRQIDRQEQVHKRYMPHQCFPGVFLYLQIVWHSIALYSCVLFPLQVRYVMVCLTLAFVWDYFHKSHRVKRSLEKEKEKFLFIIEC